MTETTRPQIEKHSIMYHAAADYAAKKHLDWESLSYDVEETASEDWKRRFWRLWFRVRWVEHLLGDRYWIEMGEQHFGVLREGEPHNPVLVSRVADRLIAGWENLNIILWASDWGLNLDEVIAVLKKININDVRVSGKRVDTFWARLVG